ncbi:peptidoglycan DD-metalloendopeptidase family protein [Deinococcus depolymerans]|uniref:M23 family metallopeptidase n=1 Tax=Deinococcus depolymerans TaxID=392408 RepID=A0ABP3MKS5_9DEIO
MSFPFPRGLTFRAAVTAALLLAAQAGAQQATPLEQLTAPLQPNLQAPADLVLDRVPGRVLEVVTDGRTSPGDVARRYGVTPGAVRVLERRDGLRLLQLSLPAREAAARPQRPASVRTYVVRAGDTMGRVARRFGLTLVDLLSVNLDRTSLDDLPVGSTLNVPTGQPGLLVRIKPGQSALSLIAGYGADLVETARANDVLPTQLQVGDELLLPGIRAESFVEVLAQRREAERQARLAQQRQLKYERFLAWKKQKERERLEAKYEAQARYEKFLAWKNSPERRAQVEAYERQAQFEAAQAAARARQTASAQRTSIRAASASDGGRSGLAWPMRSYRLTSRFAERDIAFHQQVFHGGIDLAAPYGTPIYSASAGTVTQSGYGAFGLNVWTTGGNSTLIYGHMSRAAVSVGQRVEQGQLLGYVGCTGVCTGPHLHFEVRIGGEPVDPLGLLP